MNLEQLLEGFPPFARDIKLNLSSLLSPEGTPGLNAVQAWGSALACALATGDARLIGAIEASGETTLSPEHRQAARAAATVMAMNNVYYRTMHLLDDPEVSKLPAKLRMNILAKPGIDKLDFELYSLAVSALGGCEMCLKSHAAELKKAGLTAEGIQSGIRIASVVNAAASVLRMI